MKGCKETQELLTLFCESELDEARAADVQRHLDSCPECMLLAERIKSTGNLLRQALRQIEPGPEFENKVLASLDEERAENAGTPAGVRSMRRLAVLVPAAALFLLAGLAVVLLLPPKGGSVLKGSLAQGTAEIIREQCHTAQRQTWAKIDDLGEALFKRGAEFVLRNHGLFVLSGSCYVISEGEGEARVSTPELSVRLMEAEAYVRASGETAARAGLLPPFFQRLYAAEGAAESSAEGPASSLVVVFKGRAKVEAGRFAYLVSAGEFIFADSMAEGPQPWPEFIESVYFQVDISARRMETLQPKMERYSTLVAMYKKRLRRLKEQYEMLTVENAEKAGRIASRIDFLTRVCSAHERRLDEMSSEAAAVRGPEFRERRRRAEVLVEAVDGYGPALDFMGRPSEALSLPALPVGRPDASSLQNSRPAAADAEAKGPGPNTITR